MKGGNSNEVGFVELGEGEEGVANLFDMYRAGEGGLLSVVAFELKEGGEWSAKGAGRV